MFISGNLGPDEIRQLRALVTAHPDLFDDAGRSVVRFLDIGTDASPRFAHEVSTIFSSSHRGVLAEEIQHAIDRATGLFTHRTRGFAALRRGFNPGPIGEAQAIAAWHEGVFSRIANAIESNPNSIFNYFLQDAAELVPRFRGAAAHSRGLSTGAFFPGG